MNRLPGSIRIVPLILIMGTIFFLSHQPGSEMQLFQVPGLDKLAHGFIYAGLAAAGLYAAPRKFLWSRPKTTGALIAFFCLLYGVTDEYHQSFIPGRVASLGDLAADATGAALLVCIWIWAMKLKHPFRN